MFCRNLETATKYKIALNARYRLTRSEEVEIFASTLALPPTGPINFTEITNTSFVAHWLPPRTNPFPVTYIVTFQADGESPVTFAGGKRTFSR